MWLILGTWRQKQKWNSLWGTKINWIYLNIFRVDWDISLWATRKWQTFFRFLTLISAWKHIKSGPSTPMPKANTKSVWAQHPTSFRSKSARRRSLTQTNISSLEHMKNASIFDMDALRNHRKRFFVRLKKIKSKIYITSMLQRWQKMPLFPHRNQIK